MGSVKWFLNFHYNYSSLQPYDSLFLTCTSQALGLFSLLVPWEVLPALPVLQTQGWACRNKPEVLNCALFEAEKVNPQIPPHGHRRMFMLLLRWWSQELRPWICVYLCFHKSTNYWGNSFSSWFLNFSAVTLVFLVFSISFSFLRVTSINGLKILLYPGALDPKSTPLTLSGHGVFWMVLLIQGYFPSSCTVLWKVHAGDSKVINKNSSSANITLT